MCFLIGQLNVWFAHLVIAHVRSSKSLRDEVNELEAVAVADVGENSAEDCLEI